MRLDIGNTRTSLKDLHPSLCFHSRDTPPRRKEGPPEAAPYPRAMSQGITNNEDDILRPNKGSLRGSVHVEDPRVGLPSRWTVSATRTGLRETSSWQCREVGNEQSPASVARPSLRLRGA